MEPTEIAIRNTSEASTAAAAAPYVLLYLYGVKSSPRAWSTRAGNDGKTVLQRPGFVLRLK